MKRFFGASAAILTIAVLLMACPDPNGGNDGDDTEDTPVTSVSVAKSGLGVVNPSTPETVFTGDANKVTFIANVMPASATNKTVTWASGDTSIATVDNGVVTGVAAGTTTITVTTNGKKADGNSATFQFSVKVEVDPGNIPATLTLFNQTGFVEGSTTTLPAFDANGRLKIANKSTLAGWGTEPNKVKGNTIVYLQKPLEAPFSISARVKISAKTAADGTDNGFFVGAFTDPTVDTQAAENPGILYMAGLNTTTTGRRTPYATRLTGGSVNNSAATANAFNGRTDKEYVFIVSRTDAVYTLDLQDDALPSSPSVSDQFPVLRGANATPTDQIHAELAEEKPLYLGFIISGVDVEISSIVIMQDGDEVYKSPNAMPTPIPAATGVTITSTANTVAIGRSVGVTAAVQPEQADQGVAFSIEPTADTVATINSTTGVVTGVGEGTVTVYATAVSDSTKKSTGFTITVTAAQEVLENNRSWNFQTLPVGFTNATNTASGLADVYYNQGMTLLTSIRTMQVNTTQTAPSGSDFSDGMLQPNGAATEGYASIAEVQGPFTITLKYCANTSDANGRKPGIKIGDGEAQYGDGSTGTSDPKTFTTSYTGTDKVTVLLLGASHPGRLYDIIITYTGQTPASIWEWNKGDTAPANTAAVVNGISVVRTGGTITGTTDGISMGAARWVLGYATPTYSSGTATANNAYVTNAELDLSRKFKITVDYTSATTAGSFFVYLNNNSTSSGSSVFGNSPKGKSGLLLQETPSAASGTYTVTVDPAELSLTAEATTASIDKAAVLQHSFLQFRCDSTLASFVVTKILVENVD